MHRAHKPVRLPAAYVSRVAEPATCVGKLSLPSSTIRGLSGKYPAILNISRTGGVALM